MKLLYKYPQRRVSLRAADRGEPPPRRRRPEFELLDTGVFDDDRYFDVVVEYAKAAPEDICIRIEAFNRGPDERALHVLPHLWFRNTWAWGARARGREPRDQRRAGAASGFRRLVADDSDADPLPNLPFEYRLGPRAPLRRGGRRAAVHRQRDERRAACTDRRRSRQPVRQGRVPPPRRQRRDRASTRTSSARRRRSTTARCVPAGGSVGLAPAADDRSDCTRPARRRRRDRRRSGAPRPTRSTRRSSRRRRPTTSGWCSARRSPACSGRSRSTSST